ncbi:MAG TPA: VWA domain-containing protein [Dissulfurispiraceae bacterium]|nr:VWA domain-containing protein [Dissulfurispiraceae bacterium]
MMSSLVDNLRIDRFDEDEIHQTIAAINSFDPHIRQRVLALCQTLSQASSSLVTSTLRRVNKAAAVFSFADLERWLGVCFDFLDSRGIDAFIRFASQADDATKLARFKVPAGLRLRSVILMLETFIGGVSGLDLKIGTARDSFTDTAVIYLPDAVGRFQDNDRNLFLYKLMVVHKWAQITCGTVTPGEFLLAPFVPTGTPHPDIAALFRQFLEREFACDIYNCIEAIRLDGFLKKELPGLMREAEAIRMDLYRARPRLEDVAGKAAVVEGLYQCFLAGRMKGRSPALDEQVLLELELVRTDITAVRSLRLLRQIYDSADRLPGAYEPRDCPEFLGDIRPDLVSRQLKLRRQMRRQQFEGLIKKILDMPEFEPKKPRAGGSGAEGRRDIDPSREYLVIRGKVIEVDAELKEIMEERGGIPGGILVQGSEMGGGRAVTLSDLVEEEEVRHVHEGGIKYPEWDYRRGGYRKNYCSLYEHDLRPADEPFVEQTLQRYRAQIDILRKKFEMLRREPRLLRNQRDGDTIDIDAAVEAYADIRAGITPRDGFYTRTDRQERNIAVFFLIDMSGSTKGWVNIAEKEALVLMAEALDALGDRYAMYGFSGFTRTKCDFYRIKSFDEANSALVKSRIAGIRPMDYTRMGPPVRHALAILKKVEARTKLMIILSDGKPEDWDAYKGEHAIEDTRKALLEVKERGIHSFCITIDREGQTYLPHMFGSSRYIVIDDVRKLPNRITEIYRRLTA